MLSRSQHVDSAGATRFRRGAKGENGRAGSEATTPSASDRAPSRIDSLSVDDAGRHEILSPAILMNDGLDFPPGAVAAEDRVRSMDIACDGVSEHGNPNSVASVPRASLDLR